MIDCIKKGWRRLITWLRHVPKRFYAIAGFLLAVVIYIILFFIPQQVTFNYGGETCTNRLTLFPTLHESNDQSFSIDYRQTAQIGPIVLTSTKTCFIALQDPKSGQQVASSAPFNMPLLRTMYQIIVPSTPEIDKNFFTKPVSVSEPLRLPLNGFDTVRRYNVAANNRVSACTAKDGSVTCDLASLQLTQGETYKTKITRVFKDLTTTAYEGDVAIVTPLVVTETSFPAGTVYHKPTELLIRTDKPIDTASFVVQKLGENAQLADIPSSTEKIEDTLVRITFKEELPREATFNVNAKTFTSQDGSTTLAPYAFQFTTSGGPKVTDVNIGTSNVAKGTQVVVAFDQPLDDKQDFSKLMQLGSGMRLLGVNGTQARFSIDGVGTCGDITIKITKGIQSNHGVVSNAEWSYKALTTCYSVSTIGSSVRGRPISVYTFGSGPRTIVYTGAIHGNEISTKYLMEQWIAELNANARSIPAGTTVAVVPIINPDGVASGTRVNARNIDVNRNFATSDWQKDITTVTNQPFPGGGGESAFSEPESTAIASYVRRTRPELVLSYHSIGGLLQGNGVGISSQRSAAYSQLSGYRNLTGQGGVFEYSITGTADDYYAEKLGIPSVLIELGSHTNSQFSRNKAAMWAMIR